MSTIDKIFKPRRALKSVMTNSKASVVLSSGELFVECQGPSIGKGKAKIKIGDGSTPYSSLDYALGDTSTDPISFTTNTSSTASLALDSVVSGNSLQTIIGGLKQAVSLNASSISKLNDEVSNNNDKSDINSLNARVSTNTNNINSINDALKSLTGKVNGNSSSISNLADRLNALESNSSHHWEYIGEFGEKYASATFTIPKDYLFVCWVNDSGRIYLHHYSKGHIVKTNFQEFVNVIGYI